MFKHFFKKSNDDDIFETVDPIVEQRRNEKFSKPLMTKNLKKKKLLKKVKVNKYQKKLLPKMLKRLKKK